ncbi:MAG: hypothetical protein A2170_07170 [Deltaproteobacteria bacterium RBG_13_53_10]|nr:MAG: hypothetical protein A2170_07170 [Deltaproteobacteria bacterium RBG_13_53_10]
MAPEAQEVRGGERGVGKDWVFVSDAHLTGRDPKETEAFVEFLNAEKERMGRLVLLGDLFEFLFGFKYSDPGRRAFPFADYLPVLESLQRLHRQGIKIKYFEGNHDFFLHSFFSEQFDMEVEVCAGGDEMSLGGKRSFVAHGDLSNPGHWRHLAFRRVLKNRWTYRLIDFAGERLCRRIARFMSERSYERYHLHPPNKPPEVFRLYAHKKFLEGFEIVILGHSHFPEQITEWVHGRKCLYFNAGDWMTHRSFLRFTPPDRFRLERYVYGT